MPDGVWYLVNQEDSIIINHSAIQRGLFWATSYRTHSGEEKKQGTYNFERIGAPPLDKRRRDANYSLLDENGIVRLRHRKYIDSEGITRGGGAVYVQKGDVIIGKTTVQTSKSGQEELSDNSLVINKGEAGYIDRIFTSITPNGYKLVKVVIRTLRIPEVGDKFCCFLKKTEVLYINKDGVTGWKSIKDITLKDKVAILDNDNVKYEYPEELHEYDYKGKMYELTSQQIDLTVTPNHRMWIKKRYGTGSKWKDDFEFKTADKCFGKRLKYKKNIKNFEPENWIGNTFTIPAHVDGRNKLRPAKIVQMEDWLTFFGIWIAEGWSNLQSVQIAANKPRVQKALDKCLPNMGYKISKCKSKKWCIYDVQIAVYMKQFSVGSLNKYLPEWAWRLNGDQCRILLSSMELGDGYTPYIYRGTKRVNGEAVDSGEHEGRNASRISSSNNRFYYTSSKRLADDVTRLALHSGYSTNVRVPPSRKAGYVTYFKRPNGKLEKVTSNADSICITIIKKKVEPTINHGHVKSQKRQKEKWIDYEGKVYCLTVRTGVFLVRQNGKPVWTGNSRSAPFLGRKR